MGQAWKGSSLATQEGFFGGLPFSHLTLGWAGTGGCSMGKPRQQPLAPGSKPAEEGRSPSLGCSKGWTGCRAGAWEKMAAAKSSLRCPKLFLCVKPRQPPSHTLEGTKAQASPLCHSAGATCCSLNSTGYVAGMKVALPAPCAQRATQVKGLPSEKGQTSKDSCIRVVIYHFNSIFNRDYNLN